MRRRWRPYPVDPSCKLYLPFFKFGSEQTKILDISGNNNHGVITGAVPYPGNPQMTGVGSTFNRGDFTATNAFFWSSLNLSAYAGSDAGNTPYWIELIDNAGKKATGYIGAVGAGETLGNELVTNGDFSSSAGWDLQSGFSIADGVLVLANVVNYNSAYQDKLSVGRLYKSIFTIVTYSNGGISTSFGAGSTVINVRTSTGTFTDYGVSNPYTYLGISGVNTASGTCDDLSFRQVTDPPSTAIHIVSSLNGTTRDWASIESGFDPNDIASWKINSVIPSQGMGWYFDDVDDRVVHPSINFGKTHTLLYWLRSFANAKDIIHGGAANYHIAIDGTNIYYNAGATELSQAHGGGIRNSTMIGIRRSGTTVQFFKNGIQIGANQTLDADNDLTLTTLGSYDTPGTFMGGTFMEEVGFNTTQTVQEVRNFFELTRSKYGV